jgi:hypothetical protein
MPNPGVLLITPTNNSTRLSRATGMLFQETIVGLDAFERYCADVSVDELRREYSRVLHTAMDKDALRSYLTHLCHTFLSVTSTGLATIHNQGQLRQYV